jgi:hypothetical protein
MPIEYDVNYLAVLVSAIAAMLIGALWYSPLLFGKIWIKSMKFTKKDLDKAKEKGMAKSYAIGFVAVLISAFVLSNVINAMRASTLLDGALIGFWVWLGFVATVMLNMVLWDSKPVQLYLVNVSYYLVNLAVMGAILAVWV